MDKENYEKKYLNNKKETELTIKIFLLKKWLEYYAFDNLYNNHLTVNSARLVKSNQSAHRYCWIVQDEDFGVDDESKIREIFSPIVICFGPHIQDTKDRKKDIENTHSFFHFIFSQIAKDEHYTK